jgi:hypothetical protein
VAMCLMHMQAPVGGRDKRAYHLTSSAEKLEDQLKAQRELYQVKLAAEAGHVLCLHGSVGALVTCLIVAHLLFVHGCPSVPGMAMQCCCLVPGPRDCNCMATLLQRMAPG